MRKVKVAYSTNVSITDAYRFNAVTKLKKFDVLDPCEITVFKYDATSQVEKQVRVQLEALEKDIDKQIEDVDIRSSLQDVWKQLEEPIDLSGYGLLYLNPKSMALSPVSFENSSKRATLNALLTLQPLISTNNITQQRATLPNQAAYKSGDGFQLAISVKASYDSINRLMNQSMMGMDIPFHNKHIVIDSLRVLGQQDQKLLVEVHFSGSKRGVFYLVGRPSITPEQHLVMLDVAYDLNSKSILLKTAKWMFDKRILEELRKASDYDLNPLIQETKESVNQQLNTTLADGVFLSGKADKLSVYNLVLGATDFYMIALVSGNMKLKMK
jgi:phosphopantetheine adenylyltransferase